ncbi:MAG: porin [Candidatus Omnitrophica bacterium]|nr:porin [Candidatus Omnitrophota bacterium]
MRGFGQLVRGLSLVLPAASGLLLLGGPVWADEADTAALKAEIEVLKNRLASLESQVGQAALAGGIETGEKAVPGLLQLPSGLAGLQMSGYADIAYGFNFNEPDPATTATVGRAFDNESHGFTPHAFELVLEKPITDEMPLGFRTDLFFGDDAEIIHSTGLGAATDNFDLQQAYITARAPIEGLEFKVGKFVTLLGAEVIESPANWNYSRSLMFQNSIPYTHTGALATYPLGEIGSATFGVVNGWDIVDDNNKAKSLIGNLTFTPLEDLTLSFNGITGAERAGDSRNKRSVFDTVVTWTPPIEHLTLMANYDFGHESGVTQGTAPGAAGRKGFEAAEWTGLALYAKYDLSDAWSLAGRWEWFDDKDNARLGATSIGGSALDDLDIYSYTLTSQWKLHEHVLARLEYRHDKADERVFLRDETFSDYLDTVAAELIYHF